MAHCQHHLSPKKYGYGLKWIVPVNSGKILLPTKRRVYSLALRELSVNGFQFDDGQSEFGHVRISHDTQMPTYIPTWGPISSIKTFRIDNVRVAKSYGQEMEFFQVDFTHNDFFSVDIVGNDGRKIDVSGSVLLELYES